MSKPAYKVGKDLSLNSLINYFCNFIFELLDKDTRGLESHPNALLRRGDSALQAKFGTRETIFRIALKLRNDKTCVWSIVSAPFYEI